MEVKENGNRRKKGTKKGKQRVGMGYWSSNSYSGNSAVDNGSKLGWLIKLALLLFFILYFSDTTLSSIGLVKGVWQHYNPIGVLIYHKLTVIGFIVYRAFLFFVLYKIIFSKTVKRGVVVLLPSAIYVYVCAILWDLHSLSYINIYEVIPQPVFNFHSEILYRLFKMFRII